MKNLNPVVHFEMPAKDRVRMADFYTKVFGWKTQMFGEEMGNYVTVATAETDENNMVKTPGTINGGFYPVTADMPPQYPSVVIAVSDIHEAIKNVTEAGGSVLGEVSEIPAVGYYVSFIDTEGNKVSLLQPLR